MTGTRWPILARRHSAFFCEAIDPAKQMLLRKGAWRRFSRPFHVDVQRVYFQSCIGMAFSDGYFNAEDILRDAATAMSRAKTAGRSQIELFDERMRQHVAVRVQKERTCAARSNVTSSRSTINRSFLWFRESSPGFEALVDGHTTTASDFPAISYHWPKRRD